MRRKDESSDILDLFAKMREEEQLDDMMYLCPRCAARNEAHVDSALLPTTISGRQRYPLSFVCSECRRRTVMKILNDGFNTGPTYQGMMHPARFMEDLILDSVMADMETDAVRKLVGFTDVALGYLPWSERKLARDMLRKAEGCIGNTKRRSALEGDVLLRMTTLRYVIDGNPKGVRADITRLKDTLDSLEGRFAAVFAAECCLDAKSEEECRRLHDAVVRMTSGLSVKDTVIAMARCKAAWALYCQCEDDCKRAADELIELAYDMADLIEECEYSSDILTWFCISYEKAAFCAFEAGMVDKVEELVTTMSERFGRSLTDPHGGLLAVVRYSEAIFFMGRDDRRAREGFDAIQRVMAGSIDNGPFTADRFLCSVLALERLGGGGVKPAVALETAMHMGLTEEAFSGYLELYVRALSDSRSVDQICRDLAESGVHIPEKVVVDLAEKPFENSIMWDCPVLRVMAD